jgi:hypothetical protein
MLTICCATLIALAVAFWLWPTKPKATTAVVTAVQQIREHPSHPSTLVPVNSGKPALPRVESLRQRLITAKDYLQLALSILPQAKAGDAEAEYVLFKAFRDCQGGTPGLYGGEFDTVDKAREYAQIRGHSIEEAETLFQRCHGLYTPAASVLGNRWEWLQKATDAGYPAAQADTAFERLLQDSMKASVAPGVTPQGVVALPPIGGDADPRALLAEALPSGDPIVLADIGQLQHMLHPEESRQVAQMNRVAWLYVACERGNDCSGLGPTSPINCAATDTHCMGVPALLLQMAHDNWAPVQDRVNELNAALDAKQWDKLGFGP